MTAKKLKITPPRQQSLHPHTILDMFTDNGIKNCNPANPVSAPNPVCKPRFYAWQQNKGSLFPHCESYIMLLLNLQISASSLYLTVNMPAVFSLHSLYDRLYFICRETCLFAWFSHFSTFSLSIFVFHFFQKSFNGLSHRKLGPPLNKGGSRPF